MKTRPVMNFIIIIALMSSLSVVGGCAQSSVNIKDPGPQQNVEAASINAIKVSSDASVIEIATDKPVTYTFYKVSEPAKAVIDLAQTEPGSITQPVEVNAGNIKRIEVAKHSFGGGFLSRVEVTLGKESDFAVNTDPADKSKLLITLAKPQTDESQAKPEAKREDKSQEKAEEAKPMSIGESPKTEASTASVQAAPAVTAAAVATTSAPDEKQGMAETKAETKGIASPTNETRSGGDSQERVVSAVNVLQDGIEIVVSGIDTFNTFKLTKPDRLVVDIFGARTSIASKVLPINSFGVAKARIGITPDKVRVVFDAARESLPASQVVKGGNGLRVVFAEAQGVAAAGKGVSVVASEPVKQRPDVRRAVTSKAAVVEALDFKLVDGHSLIAIKFTGECNPGKPVKTAEGLMLAVRNCQIPRKLQRTLDTSSFASVVTGVTPYQVKVKGGGDARFLVKLRADAPSTVRQEGEFIYWEIKNTEVPETPALISEMVKAQPAAVSAKEEKPMPAPEVTIGKQLGAPAPGEKKAYTGRKVTLEFSDADVRKIFQLIAEVSNLNFLIADDVTGTISIKLVNVPWDQALDVILESKNLDMKREGNIVQIKPKGKFITQEQETLEAVQKQERSAGLKTVVWDVNYATLGDIKTQLDALKSANPKANISTDARSNKIIINDIEEKLPKYRELLDKLDVPEKQVMIEARIVEASANFTRDLGVQWGVHYKDGSASFASINALDSTFGGVVSGGLPTSTTGGGAMGVSFGKLNSNIQLDMRLSAAATTGQIKIISTPKVVTLNNKAAKISQGQSIPYQTTSAEGTKTEFVEAALTLEVTPHITADGNVGMKVKASNNSPGSGTPPPINKKEATTELVVKNGETTVIGGIYVDNDTDTNTGVPFLMDIPLLGWLFKSNTKSKLKTELLIFITPKIII